MKSLIIIIFLIGTLATVYSKDIYVRSGAHGNGSKESPSGQLWKVMERALRNDVIHVAQGVYNGKGGAGSFLVKIPYLTLAGGYNDSFTQRDPFMYFTVLERASDYKGDTLGLPQGIVSGEKDHSHLILDGFVLDGQSRNAYKKTGDLNPKGSYYGNLFHSSSQNIKIRNCILVNPFGVGIYCKWMGEENEITNSFVLNTWYTGISTRSAQKKSIIKIQNCTVAFQWFQSGKGGGTGIFIGSSGEAVLDKNLIIYGQEYGINNSFANDNTMLYNNVIYQYQKGYYKYMDSDGKNLLITKKKELMDLNADAEFYSLWEAENNHIDNPELKPDKLYFDGLSHAFSAFPGNINLTDLKTWRKKIALSENTDSGTPVYGAAYPRDRIIPQLISPLAGVKRKGPFNSYTSTDANNQANGYKETAFEHFKKGSKEVETFKKTKVQFRAKMGPNKMRWFDNIAPKKDYLSIMLLAPWEKDEYTRDFVYGYILKGSQADKNWTKYYRKKSRYNEKDGVNIKGTAFYLNSPSYTYPIAVIIDHVSLK